MVTFRQFIEAHDVIDAGPGPSRSTGTKANEEDEDYG